MQFTVPKFLERESVVAFGLTFKNLAIMAGLGFVLFILYYVLPKVVFVLLAIIVGGAFLASTFIKVGGQTLPQLIGHGFGFLTSSRTYVWDKNQTQAPVKLVKKEVKKIETKGSVLKLAPKSHLSALGAKIDFMPPSKEDLTDQL
ncbi:MAG: hypothetical protein PHE77_03840 [Candidatus Pacebacteria bacterium]|nr:hypothetical protein [Candidatus Paceibacterota bacterium]